MSHKTFNTVVEMQRDDIKYLFYCSAIDPTEEIAMGQLRSVFGACQAEHEMRQLIANCDVRLIESAVTLNDLQKRRIIVTPKKFKPVNVVFGTNFPDEKIILDENTHINYLRYEVTLSPQPSHHQSHQSRVGSELVPSQKKSRKSKQSHAAASSARMDSDEVPSPAGEIGVNVSAVVERVATSGEGTHRFQELVKKHIEKSHSVTETFQTLVEQIVEQQRTMQNASMMKYAPLKKQEACEMTLIAQTYLFMLHGATLSQEYHDYPTEFTKIDYFSPIGCCPSTDHAQMLLGFNTSKQKVDNIDLFLKGAEQCAANGKIARLQPIVFTAGTLNEGSTYIGLYRYDFWGRPNPRSKNIKDSICNITMTKLMSYPQFNPTKYYTYSNLFQMVSADIKTRIKAGEVIIPDGFHIIFFNCRKTTATIMPRQIAPISNTQVLSSRLQIEQATGGTAYNIQILESTMPPPPMTTDLQGPLGKMSHGITHFTEQSCLLNLFAFYGMIPYAEATVMGAMMGSQQRTNLTTGLVVVAGENVRFFINVINDFLTIPPEIDRRYIIERMDTVVGLQKIMDNIQHTLRHRVASSNLNYAWFVKLYPIPHKPSSELLSESGHWISLWIDSNGEINYVDPQGLSLHFGSTRSFYKMTNAGADVRAYPELQQLIATYKMVDIVYVLTQKPQNGNPTYLTGLVYTKDQIVPRRLPKGGRRSRKHKATANSKTHCKKRM